MTKQIIFFLTSSGRMLPSALLSPQFSRQGLRLQLSLRSFVTVTRSSFNTSTAAVAPVFSSSSAMSSSSSPCSTPNDIEELHQQACDKNSSTYIDPETGFHVFTRQAHLKRGTCCGSRCRHCPYDHVNVKQATNKTENRSLLPPLKSITQRTSISQKLPQSLHTDSTSTTTTTTNSNSFRSSIRSFSNATETAHQQKETTTGGRHGGRFTDKNVPYTRTGDTGTSQLLTGERRLKSDLAFEAMGTVDELCSIVGIAHATTTALPAADNAKLPLQEWLLDIMSRLFDIGSHVAKPKKDPEQEFVADGVGNGFDIVHVQELEDWIDLLTEELPELRSFLLPTGSVEAAHFHHARCVARRAERVVLPLVSQGVCDPHALQYLNRLSDFLFSAARYVNHIQDKDEIVYKKPTRTSKQRVATKF